MALMFQELNELEDRIKGNKDLGEMENLMKSTNDVMKTHISSTKTLKQSIMSISKDAAAAVDALDFYNFSDSDEEDGGKPKKLKKTKNKYKSNLDLVNEDTDEEDDEAKIVIEGGTFHMSHEQSKLNIYN
jgi:hypothetical protein